MNENVTEVVAVLGAYYKYFSARTHMNNDELVEAMEAVMEELLEITSKIKSYEI